MVAMMAARGVPCRPGQTSGLPPDIWERTLPEAQAYIRALAARVAALEGMRQALQAQLKQTSHHSSRPPSSDLPYSKVKFYG